ncbi:50S ribosomal protein L2 [bacterium]|nr:50S ribosomal protein L2 [bacterium]
MLKIYKPTTPGRRNASVVQSKELSKSKPPKNLRVYLKSRAGRNNKGSITVRHKGGGAKKLYRLIDFRRDKFDVPAKVESIEYDPYRSAWIALVCYKDGERRYILAPKGLKVGSELISSNKKIEAEVGNRMPLKYIPTGYFVYNIELSPGSGGKLVRSAGSRAVLMTCEEGYAQIKFPSGEIRKIPEDCLATVGQVSNPDWRLIRWGKAGRKRLKGIRPSVRGKAMNPVDHPHGGGEGHSPIGLVHPKTPWGKPALGVKTRKNKKMSDKFIIKRRH